MCGIWLVCGSSCSDILHCNNAFSRIKHRGPDAWRLELDTRLHNVILGFHRLAIVDGLHGMQPMRLVQYPQLFLLCNGEIFNQNKITEEYALKRQTACDVEVILHLYAKYGIEACAKALDGEFAFAIIDLDKHQLHVARDPYGVRPVFKLSTSSGVLGLSSEAKGLISLMVDLPEDTQRSIEQFPPGCWESYKVDPLTGLVRLTDSGRFYEIGVSRPAFSVPWDSLDNTDIHGNIRKLLLKAVDKRLMSDRRIGCLLSGGLDSSLIASLLVKEAKRKKLPYPIQTFSIGLEGSPDLIAAKKVAEFIGSEHHELVVSEEDVVENLDEVLYTIETADITTVRASIPMYLLSRYIRSKTDTTVIFSGEGSDEVTQGYIYFRDAPSAAEAHLESLRLLKDIHLYDGLRGDRTTAANSLELRLPFLDLQFTSYYLSLPAESRQPQNGVEKHLLRAAFAEAGLLPDEILWRPKEAFSDGVASTKKSLFTTLQEAIGKRISGSSQVFEHCPPKTTESLYYRLKFEENFKGQAEKLMPYFWMPRWTDVQDPSARFINHYKSK